MTRAKKRTKPLQKPNPPVPRETARAKAAATAAATESASELERNSEVYAQGAFKFLRLAVHILGVGQFVYGVYYHWTNVHWPVMDDEEELQGRWGGKFKYLTFLDAILQAFYHGLALLNDLIGTNAIDPQPMPVLRRVKDYVFAALAFPIAVNVCVSFWFIYAMDREFIFPAALDSIFPNWLNHIVHTNVAMMALMDLVTCFRLYPSRMAGLSGTVIFMILYIIWMHIVRFFSGQWVYPLLEALNMPMRSVLLGAMLVFTVVCYYLGEWLNAVIWAPELKLLRRSKSHNL